MTNSTKHNKLGSYFYFTEELPKSLNADEERQLLGLLGGVEDGAARKELIERNLRLVVYIAQRFGNTGVNMEDLISVGSIGLVKAVNTFKPEKQIRLATYATRCIENEILMELRRDRRRKD